MTKKNSDKTKICIAPKSKRTISYIEIADKEIEKTRRDVDKIEKKILTIQNKMRFLL